MDGGPMECAGISGGTSPDVPGGVEGFIYDDGDVQAGGFVGVSHRGDESVH